VVQWQIWSWGNAQWSVLFFSLLPILFFPSPPILSLPLEVGPLNSARGLGSAVISPSGVWGGAPAEIESGAFKS